MTVLMNYYFPNYIQLFPTRRIFKFPSKQVIKVYRLQRQDEESEKCGGHPKSLYQESYINRTPSEVHKKGLL